MILFAEHIGPRLSYVTTEICRRLHVADFRITTSKKEFSEYHGTRINYSSEEIPHSVQIVPSGFLNERSFRSFVPDHVILNEVPCFFSNPSKGDLPFDVFSSVFYLLSRYEEYQSAESDQHGRFPAYASLLVQLNVIEKAVVERQIDYLHSCLIRQFPESKSERKAASKMVTIDIDNAWAYKNKPAFVRWGAGLRNLLKGEFSVLMERRKVIKGEMSDPYDTYNFLIENLKDSGHQVRFFFLLGDRGKFDKNIPHDCSELSELINRIDEHFPVGIHPSYASHLDQYKLHSEVARLQSIIHDPVLFSRFHYLRFRLPESYRNLEKAGIREEHSMGHASVAGFRAGTCFPFFFYDLVEERASSLEIIPFCAMDGTLNEYMGLDPVAARKCSDRLWSEVERFGGVFSVLWHNETLSERGKWQGWRDVFLHQL